MDEAQEEERPRRTWPETKNSAWRQRSSRQSGHQLSRIEDRDEGPSRHAGRSRSGVAPVARL